MGSKQKPDPYMIDEENAPLTEEEIKTLMSAEEFFAKYGRFKDGPGRPPQGVGKQQVTLRIDKDVLEHFKADGPGWQTRLNDTLAEVVRERKKA